MIQRFRALLASPVPPESLAVVRISFGVVMLLTALKMLMGVGGVSWCDAFFPAQPDLWTLRYPLLEWLSPLPPFFLTIVIDVLALSGLFLAFGLWTRWASILVFLSWTYLFLLDKSYYNNHYYLMSLMAFLLALSPLDCVYRLRFEADDPSLRRPTIPFWTIFLLRAQLFFVYFYAGVVKLNYDWLVDATTMRFFLDNPAIVDPLRPFLSPERLEQASQWLLQDWVVRFFAVSGMVFDLAIGFLLIIRRTRVLAFGLVLLFHGVNHIFLFDDIDFFPVLAVSSTTIFLEPDWPRRVWISIRRRRFPKPDWRWLVLGGLLIPGVGLLLGWSLPPTRRPSKQPQRLPLWVLPFVVVWLIVQAVAPVRHFFIEGEVNWTQEGELFSWRVKGHVKDCRNPRFVVEDSALLQRSKDATTIDWKGLKLEPVVYIDVDPQTVNWRKLPALVVVFEPLVGERIFFNPYHGDRETPIPPAEGAAWIERFWQSRYHRAAAEIDPCISFQEAFSRLQKKIWDDPLQTEARQIVALASEEAKRFAAPATTKREKRRASVRIAYLLGNLVQSPKVRSLLKEDLSLCRPLEIVGGDGGDAPFFLIRDPRLLQSNASYRVLDWINPAEWKPAGGEQTLTVLLPWENMAPFDLRPLPPFFVFEDASRGRYILWNLFQELAPLRQTRIVTGPLDAHAYALHIADVWNRRFGRRPQVFVDLFLKLNQHPEQRAIRPDVDLAKEPRKAFGHHPWVTEHRRADEP